MTAQFPDRIMIDGEMEMLFANPLEEYFRLEGVERPEVLKRPSCTACWRGYVASWEVRDGVLLLTGVMAQATDEDILRDMFPDADGPVAATWVSGLLVAPRGEQIEYVHMGYMSRYERELWIEVEEGRVISIRERDNKEIEALSVDGEDDDEPLPPPLRPPRMQ